MRLQTCCDGVLIATRLDLSHDCGGGGVEREHFLGTCLEEHAAEFLFAKFDEFCELHVVCALVAMYRESNIVTLDWHGVQPVPSAYIERRVRKHSGGARSNIS